MTGSLVHAPPASEAPATASSAPAWTSMTAHRCASTTCASSRRGTSWTTRARRCRTPARRTRPTSSRWPGCAPQFARRSVPVKAALLDQTVCAGVGNIYADEACWIARIDPRMPANELGPRRVARLHARGARDLLEHRSRTAAVRSRTTATASAARGCTTSACTCFVAPGSRATSAERPSNACASRGRSTHFCPRCQKSDTSRKD